MILRRPRVANFAGIIKIATMFIKKTFKDPQKSLKSEKLLIRMQSTHFLIHLIEASDFQWKVLMSAEYKGCVTWFTCLGKI